MLNTVHTLRRPLSSYYLVSSSIDTGRALVILLAIAFWHVKGCCPVLSRDRSRGACELGELGLEERDDGGVLVVLGDAKGRGSIGRKKARISSGSK